MPNGVTEPAPDDLRLVLQLEADGDRTGVRATSTRGEAHGETATPPAALLDQLATCDPANIPPAVLAQAGSTLYRTLTAGDVASLAADMLADAAQRGRPIQLELRLDPDQVALAQFPWEMIADENGRYLLRDGLVNLSRYITYPQPPPRIDAAIQDLPFLQVVSMPPGLDPLNVITPPLDHLETLSHATFLALTKKLLLERARLWGLQFDGHGLIALRCGNCGKLNDLTSTECVGCRRPLQSAARIGVLAFEKDGQADLVTTEDFGSVVYNAGVRIAVLLSCESARLGNRVVFSGLAPGLILAGVPAVIGMQYPILDTFAAGFAEAFYLTLLQTHDVLEALGTARRVSLREAWYSPVLYMRQQRPQAPLPLTSTFQDRTIDSAVPGTASPGSDFLARVWIRRPETPPLSDDQLRGQLNIAPGVPVLTDQAQASVEFEPVPGRQFRRGQIEVSLTAPTCLVTPETINLFVDERLDAPPAIFLVRPRATGAAPLIFTVSQDGGRLATIVHTVQVKAEAPGTASIRSASSSLPASAGIDITGGFPPPPPPAPAAQPSERTGQPPIPRPTFSESYEQVTLGERPRPSLSGSSCLSLFRRMPGILLMLALLLLVILVLASAIAAGAPRPPIP